MGYSQKISLSPLYVQLLPSKTQVSVDIVHNRRAKRYLLKIARNGRPRLTIPNRGTQTEALKFLNRNLEWLGRSLTEWKRRAATRNTNAFTLGSVFAFRGKEVTLLAEPNGLLLNLRFGSVVIGPVCPDSDYRQVVIRHMRAMAEKELHQRTVLLAAQHGVSISRVTVRAQRTRWGSCSNKGVISLNWRLIQTPPFVLDYIILHELVHRKHMNHSKRYWAEVARLCPNYLVAEKWLKEAKIDLRSPNP